MKLSVNEKVKMFYLGDDEAWEDILDEIHEETAEKLTVKFRNLPEAELYDCFADWQTEFYAKVKYAQAEATEKAADDESAAAEYENLMVECCENSTKFRLARDTPFKAWVWRVIFNRAVDLYRDLKNVTSLENREFDEFAGASFPAEEKNYAEASDADLILHFILLKSVIISALDEDELLYFEIWLEKGHDPGGREVGEVFAREAGKAVDDYAVTKLKQRFLAKSYLALQEVRYSAQATLDVFAHRFDKSAAAQLVISDLMLERIWQIFSADEKTIAVSKNKISRLLWSKLETKTFRRPLQTEILAAAYRCFHRHESRPPFCQTIEIFAADKFGGQIREIFMNKGEV